MNGAEQFWREQAESSRAEILATCEAIGTARYWLGPYANATPSQRLASLREVISDLAVALNLDPIAPTLPTQSEGREPR